MKSAQALTRARRAVAERRVRFSSHALEESMPDDGVYIPDVLHVLEHASAAVCENDPGTKWKLYGLLPRGDEYAVVCHFTKSEIVVVVTTHEPP